MGLLRDCDGETTKNGGKRKRRVCKGKVAPHTLLGYSWINAQSHDVYTKINKTSHVFLSLVRLVGTGFFFRLTWEGGDFGT